MGFSRMDVSRRAGAAACAAALLLTAVPAAPAADADPWLAGLARRLRAEPVQVSDSVSRAVSASELAALRAVVKTMPWPTRVAILSGEPRNEDVPGPYVFDVPELLGGALDRPGMYIVADAANRYRGSLQMTAVGVRPRVAAAEVERAVSADLVAQTRVVTRVRYALRLAATGERRLVGAADRKLDEELAGDRDQDDASITVAFASAGAAGLVGFAIPALLWCGGVGSGPRAAGARAAGVRAAGRRAGVPPRRSPATPGPTSRTGRARPSRASHGAREPRGGVRGRRAGGGGGWRKLRVLVAIVAAIGVLLAGAAAVLVHRRRARLVDDRPLLPGRVFALAREATRDELAERADEMLVELSALIDAAPASKRTGRALDAYEAAERALRSGQADVPDLVGALVCIGLGLGALRDERTPAPPCAYDPRHGPAGPPVTVDGTVLRCVAPAARTRAPAGLPTCCATAAAGRISTMTARGPRAATARGQTPSTPC